jgi:gliding motility-associated-like protein
LITGGAAASTYQIAIVSNGLTASAGSPANGIGLPATEIQDDKWTNTTGSPVNVVYTITPKSAGGCTGAPFTLTVTVNPEPVVAAVANQTFCPGASINLPLTGNVAGATYAWTNSNPLIGLAFSGTGDIIYTAPANNTGAAITGTITVTATASGCTSSGLNTKTFTITISPTPIVNAIADVTVCSGAVVPAVTFSSNTGGGETYAWTNDNAGVGLPVSGTTNLASYTAPVNTSGSAIVGHFSVVATKGTCVGPAQTFKITINPEPVVTAVASPSYCAGDAVSIPLVSNVAGSVITWTNSNTSIGLSGSGTGDISYIAPANSTGADIVGTITVIATSNGCVSSGANSKTFTITIKPSPVVNAMANITICSGGSVVVPSFGSNVVAGGVTFNWTNDNPGIGLAASGTGDIGTFTAAVNTTGSPFVANISFSGTNGTCTGPAKTFTITIMPEPVVGAVTSIAVCSGGTISPITFTSNIAGGGETFNWTNDNNAIGLALSGSGNIPGYTAPINTSVASFVGNITVTATKNGCTSTGANPKTFSITVYPQPLAPASTSIARCSGQSVNQDLQAIVNSVGGNSLPSTFTYTLTADLPNDLSPAVFAGAFDRTVPSSLFATETFSNFTNHDVTLTYTITPISLANNCAGAPFVLKVIVHPEPVGKNVNDPQCASTLNWNIQSKQITNGVSSNFTYTVSSDNVLVPAAPNRVVASAAPITDAYVNNTGTPATITYTITPVSQANGCTGSPFNYVVVISPTPVGADATLAANCSRDAINIDPQTHVTNGVTSTFSWTATYDPGLTGGAASGIGNLTGTLTNQTKFVLNVVYKVTPSSGPCPGTPFFITQPVNPEPVMDPALATKTINSDNATSPNPTAIVLGTNGISVAASTYDISLVSQDPGLTGVPTTGTGLAATAIQNDKFNNVGPVPLKVVYQVIPKSAGCYGAPFLITVTVNPEPVLAAISNTVCSRDISNITLATNGTSVGAAQYQLISVTVPPTLTAGASNTTVGTSGGVSLISNDTYVNNTNGPLVVTYSIVGFSAAAPIPAKGLAQTITLTINPEPTLVPGTWTVCSGVATGISIGTALGSPTITSFDLTRILISGGVVAAGTNRGTLDNIAVVGGVSNYLAADIFTNTSNIPVDVTYTIVPYASGCKGLPQTITVRIDPAPALANSDTKVCTGEASEISFSTPNSVAATSYNISNVAIQAGLIQTAGNTGIRNGVGPNEIKGDRFTNTTGGPLTVTYTVVPVAGTCLGPATDVVLTVEPTITATPVLPFAICSGGVTSIALSSTTSVTSGAISFNYTAVSSVGGLITGFIPAASNLQINSTIADNLVNNSNNPATVTYQITPIANGAKNGGGCTGVPMNVVVTVEPTPKVVASPSVTTICEGVASNIVLTSPTNPSAGTLQFDLVGAPNATGGMSLSSPVVMSYTSGQSIADVWSNPTAVQQTVTYTLRPSVMVGGVPTCTGNDVTVTLNINPSPVLSTSIINPILVPAAICSNDLVNVSLTSDVSGTVNTWTSSVTTGTATGHSGGSGDLIFQTLKNTGSIPANVRYHITPKASGCAGVPVDVNIEVDPIPDLVFAAPGAKCFGDSLKVALTSAVAGTNFNWVADPNNSGIDTTPSSGLMIKQVVKDTLTSAEDFITYTITAVGPGATACTSTPKVMSFTASPKMNGIFQNDSTWLCTGSKDFLQISLQGQAPFTLQYTDGSSTFTSTKVGNFKSIQIQPSASTTYQLVSLKDALGCSIPLSSKVVYTVNNTDPTFNIISPLAVCTPDVTSFQFNQVAGTTYNWQWGDGNDSTFVAGTSVAGQVIKHTFINSSLTSSVKPNIVLTTSLDPHFPNSGCARISTKSITVYAQLKTNVSIDKPAICSGDVVRLTNQTAGVLSTGHSWYYRDQGTAQQQEPKTSISVSYTLSVDATKNNPQIVEIVYHATNGHCPADTVIQVAVYKTINADFSYTATHFLSGNAVATFTNASLEQGVPDWAPFRFDWDYGLGASPATLTSSASPINVNYSSPGFRQATLTATNIAAEAAGLSCTSTITKTVSIELDPLIAEFKADPIYSCYPSKITITENLSTGDQFKWAVIDKFSRDTVASSNALLPVFSISSEGSYLVYLKVSSSLTGQLATDTASIVIFPKPQAIFDVFPSTVYVPDQEITTINGSAGTANQYLWDFGDGGTSTSYQPKYKYKFEGVDSLKFTAIDAHLVSYPGGVKDTVKCSATNFKLITAKQGGVAKIPNAFTPNTSGPSGGVGGVDLYNYVFLPQVKGVEEFNMQIYDRWGNLVFESNNQTIGWDGYDQNGRLMPAGVYVYKLTLRLSDQQRTTQVGDVTLIR